MFGNDRAPKRAAIPPQKGLMTFHGDFTALSSGQGMVITHVGKNAQVAESDSLGVWTEIDSIIYYTNEAVLSDLKGNLTGFFKVSGFYHLTSPDSYEGNSYYQFLDPHHEVNGPQGWVCNAGVRIKVESTPTGTPPPCVSPQP